MYADPFTGCGLLEAKTSVMLSLLNRLLMLKLIFDSSNSEFCAEGVVEEEIDVLYRAIFTWL